MNIATNSESERLNKFLAERLGISRREADKLISSGRVTINGVKALLGARVGSGEAVSADGKSVEQEHEFKYILLHKPVGYVCSRRGQGGTPTIYEILPEKYKKLKTVGRLDKDSSGLILLTDDGDFAYKMTHPKFAKYKVYEVKLNQDLEPFHQQVISEFGLQLEDGLSRLSLTRIVRENELNLSQFEQIKLSPKERKWFKVEMSEGRNRQIRRTFSALGYTVEKLHRVEFGKYHLNSLRPGDFIEVKANFERG